MEKFLTFFPIFSTYPETSNPRIANGLLEVGNYLVFEIISGLLIPAAITLIRIDCHLAQVSQNQQPLALQANLVDHKRSFSLKVIYF